MQLDVAGRSDTGKVRTRNEDRYTVQALADGSTVCVLADGMGGHTSGHVAATVAVEATVTALEEGAALDTAVSIANRAVYNRAAADATLRNMGTTIVAVQIRLGQRTATVAHVGDSRVYLVREGTARPLTVDHSWVMDEVRAGRLTPEEAQRSSRRNMLTRALGLDPEVAVDTSVCQLEEGDAILLCSDGVHGYVTDDELASACAAPAAEAARGLVALVLERGAPDNATVIVARVVGDNAVLATPVTETAAPNAETQVRSGAHERPAASRPRRGFRMAFGIAALLALVVTVMAVLVVVRL